MNTIEIWQPRYKDNTVLVAKKNVKNGSNVIIFTKAKHLEGKAFLLTDEEISKFPVGTNGKIDCYIIPMEYVTERRV